MHVFPRAFLWLGVLVPVMVVVAGVGTAIAAPAVELSAREREIDDAVCGDFDRAAKWSLALLRIRTSWSFMGANATPAESLAFGWRAASTFDRLCAAGARRSSCSGA